MQNERKKNLREGGDYAANIRRDYDVTFDVSERGFFS